VESDLLQVASMLEELEVDDVRIEKTITLGKKIQIQKQALANRDR